MKIKKTTRMISIDQDIDNYLSSIKGGVSKLINDFLKEYLLQNSDKKAENEQKKAEIIEKNILKTQIKIQNLKKNVENDKKTLEKRNEEEQQKRLIVEKEEKEAIKTEEELKKTAEQDSKRPIGVKRVSMLGEGLDEWDGEKWLNIGKIRLE